MLLSKRQREGRAYVSDASNIPQGTLDLLDFSAASPTTRSTAGRSPNASNKFRIIFCATSRSLLYPALHRLERRGWIAAKWGTSDNNRRAKFYRSRAEGPKADPEAERDAWEALTTAVAQVLWAPRREVSDADRICSIGCVLCFAAKTVEAEMDEELRFHYEHQPRSSTRNRG